MVRRGWRLPGDTQPLRFRLGQTPLACPLSAFGQPPGPTLHRLGPLITKAPRVVFTPLPPDGALGLLISLLQTGPAGQALVEAAGKDHRHLIPNILLGYQYHPSSGSLQAISLITGRAGVEE